MYLTAYRATARLVHRLPLPTGKLAESVAGRQAARGRWVAWAAHVGPAPHIIWVHAASVGEAMAAIPVIRRLHTARPETRFVLSHSSPSVQAWSFPEIDHTDFVPLDEPAHVAPVLDAVRPALLLFSRGDLWPELVTAAAARGIPIAVTGGVVSARSSRLRWPARAVLRRAAASVGYLGAVSLEDAGRWHRLGVRPEVMRVSGDPRHDYALERDVDLTVARHLSSWKGGEPVLVAGSIEPEGERPLIASLAALMGGTTYRAILVPHRPSSETIGRLARRLDDARLPYAVWDASDAAPAPPTQPIVLVRTLGILCDLYLVADVAYVGGGFGRRGLHSVIEPAAFALPIVVGPRWQRHADAAALIGGAGAVSTQTHAQLTQAIGHWLHDRDARRRAGLAARRALSAGAASIDAAAVQVLLQ